MKKTLTTIITVFVVGCALAPSVFAQTQAELEAQYESLLHQVIAALQTQIAQLQGGSTMSLGGDFVLPIDTTCGIRYSGDESIMAVQQELQNQGYTITKVDGKIGPETRAAVSAFQSAVGALKVDGLIGAETRALLSRYSVACVGEPGVSVADTSLVLPTVGVCRLDYVGVDDAAAIQQE